MEARGAPHAGKSGKGAYQHNHRHGHANARQRRRAFLGDMADIHAVHHIIKNVYQLRRDGWNGQVPQKLAYRLVGQSFLTVLHRACASFECTNSYYSNKSGRLQALA